MLNKSPLDILSAVAIFLSGSDITRLWMTGDQKLRLHLRHGVTKLEFELRYFRSNDWPCIASEFINLTSLIISCGGKDGISCDLKGKDNKIPSLSPKLQILDLQISDAISACKAAFDDPTRTFSNLHTLKLSYHHDDYPLSLEEVQFPPNLKCLDFRRSLLKTSLPVNCLPPHLESLAGEFSFVQIKDESTMLPTSLQNIDVLTSMATTNANRPADFLRCLARSTPNLQSLRMTLLRIDNTIAENFPRSLTLLRLEKLAQPVNASLLFRLPPSLTKIKGLMTQNPISAPEPSKPVSSGDDALGFGLEDEEDSLVEWKPVIPPGLRAIPHLWISTSAIPFLPPDLDYLSVRANFRSLKPFSAQFEQFPLVTLQMHSLVGLSSKLPSSLKHLKLRESADLGKVAQYLPQGLLTVKIYERSPTRPFKSPEEFKHLPPNLTKLHCEALFKAPSKQDLELFHALESAKWLPRKLIELKTPPIQAIPSGWFSGLPSTLTNLSITTSSLKGEYLQDLPKALQKFVCKGLAEVFDHQLWFPNLPRGLAYFELQFQNPSAIFLESTTSITYFEQLPPFLTRLSLPKLGFQFPPDYYLHIPRSLSVLTLNGAVYSLRY